MLSINPDILVKSVSVRRRLLLLAMVLQIGSASVSLHATDYHINPSNFTTAHLSALSLVAGDKVLLDDGVYNGGGQVKLSASGTGPADGLITLMATNPGKAVLQGTTELEISGAFIVVSDLKWDSAYSNVGSPQYGQIVVFSQAHDCRLTECVFVNCGDKTKTTSPIVTVRDRSERIRIDHNLFQGSLAASVGFRVKSASDSTTAGPWHWVDHNYFKDIERLTSNGQESIQIGQNCILYGYMDMHVVIESNLFENTIGDMEIISNKSSCNWIRFNTFSNCLGDSTTGVNLRGGSDCEVEGNFFLHTSYGVNIFGENHVVLNNYFGGTENPYGANGYSTTFPHPPYKPKYIGAINLSAGTGTEPSAWDPVARRCLIAYNTIANSTHASSYANPYTISNPGVGDGIVVGSQIGRTDYSSFPQGSRLYGPESNWFYNNLVVGTEGLLFRDVFSTDTVWSTNYGYPTSLASLGVADSGVVVLTSAPLDSSSPFHLNGNNPPTNSADQTVQVPSDMDGQPRTDGLPDVGADEYSTATVTQHALAFADVGPVWAGRNSAADSAVIWGPSSLTATASGPTAVSLTWADNSPTQTGFEVRYRPANGFWKVATTTAPANATNAVMQGLTPNTVYSFQVRALGGNGSAWSPVAVDITGNAYPESDGSVTIEAENYHSTYAGTVGSYGPWSSQATATGFVGLAYMQASSQSGGATWADAPGLNYLIRLQTAGTYHVWARCNAYNTGHDSIRWGWNGTEHSNATYGTQIIPCNSQWVWINLGTIAIASGDLGTPQTFNLRRREPGELVDRFFLTTASTDPSTLNGGNGPAESAPDESPRITGFTPDTTVNVGDPATFAVTVVGSPAVSYQWSKLVQPSDPTVSPTITVIQGATSSSYTISSVVVSDQANYFVTATNAAGQTSSERMFLAVVAPPTFTTQPQSQTVNFGDDVTLSVTTDMAWNRKLKWQLNGADIPNATNAAYVIPAANTSDAGYYTVIASNAAGATTSNPATLTISGSPTMPQYWVESGGAVAFEAESYDTIFAGSAPYELWATSTAQSGYVGSAEMLASSQTGTPLWADAPGMDYRIKFVTAGTYKVWARCYATNTGRDSIRWGWNGTEYSNATSGTQISPVANWDWIKLGTITVASGDLATAQTLNFRRREMGANVDRFFLTTATTDPGTIGGGQGPNSAARSGESPQNIAHSSSTVAEVGSNISLTVTADYAERYRWFRNGVEIVDSSPLFGTSSSSISGSTSATLTITNVPDLNASVSDEHVAGVAGTYTVEACNAFGRVMSDSFVLLVDRCFAPPASRTMSIGSPVIFAATPDLWYNAGSVVVPSFQWYKDTNPINGATDASLAIPAAVSTDAGNYHVRVTMGDVYIDLPSATLTVQ